MIVPIETTLIKSKSFKAVFTLGLLCVLVAVVLRAVLNFNQDSCIYDDYCDNTYGGPDLCIDQGYIYCCGGSGYQYCGNRHDCYGVTALYSKMYCQGMVTAYWVLEGVAVFCLIVLMIISCQHRRRVQTNRLPAYPPPMPQNIIYTDTNFNQGLPQNQPQLQQPQQQQQQQHQYQPIIINESLQGDSPYNVNTR